MIATGRGILCVLFIWLLVLPTESSWLSKTYKKLENSAKKRIAEGIAIAIKGGPRRRRFVPESNVFPSDVNANEPYVFDMGES